MLVHRRYLLEPVSIRSRSQRSFNGVGGVVRRWRNSRYKQDRGSHPRPAGRTHRCDNQAVSKAQHRHHAIQRPCSPSIKLQVPTRCTEIGRASADKRMEKDVGHGQTQQRTEMALDQAICAEYQRWPAIIGDRLMCCAVHAYMQQVQRLENTSHRPLLAREQTWT